ncbi:MAG: putative protease YhbU precursor [Firmicutes bacterium ADurb.Bin193]|nr:MAG: putative protease YhbU precursor [Firmicutes bacterium ADurb.Bin193]
MGKWGELLAPAGDRDALLAAVEAGADAVYLAGKRFGARALAKNFTDAEIEWAVDYCHLRGVKVYITVNTLISDRELSEALKFIAFINDIGADGVIIQDLGVALLAREVAPELSLHASTQATVYDSAGAVYFEKLGFRRVVLARELTAQKIKEITSSVNIETEIFVHGAMCTSYSGQCLASSMIGGRSGNRGVCAGPCRLSYKIGNRKGFLLSIKDLCLIRHLDTIRQTGARSLKIEGRMKGADYVKTVVSIYRKYMDSGAEVTPEDYEALERIFYRGGFTDGYFTGVKGAGMFCPQKPDNPYKMQDGKAFSLPPPKKTAVRIECWANLNSPMRLQISDRVGNTVVCSGELAAEEAVSRPLTKERLKDQLSKLGDTVFYAEDIVIHTDENISLPISEINSVRREAVRLLEEKIIKSFKRSDSKIPVIKKGIRTPAESLEISVQIRTEAQLNALDKSDYDYIYIPLDIAVKRNCFTDKTAVVLPRISPENLAEILNTIPIRRALMTNIGQAEILRRLGFEIIADHTLNIFNTRAAEHFGYTSRITLSSELMLSQIRGISCDMPIEVIAYGRLPLMITENSISGSKTEYMEDRTGAVFPIMQTSEGRSEIFNSKPIVMSDKLCDIKNSGVNVIRLFFTTETPSECESILRSYKTEQAPKGDFTRGKFYKGV